MTIRSVLFFLAFSSFGSAVAQSNCWPQCVSNQTITMAFRLRRPTMTIAGPDDCREQIRKMIEGYDREDQALTSFTRNACAALSGWVEINPGTCTLGGPFCCTAKPSHWRSDITAWSRFIAAQTKIGNQRKAEVEAFTNRCSSSAKVSTTNQQKEFPPSTTASQVQQQSQLASQPSAVNVQQFSKEMSKTATQNMLANFGKNLSQPGTNNPKPVQSTTSSSTDKSTLTELIDIAKDISKDINISKIMRTYELANDDLTKDPQDKENGVIPQSDALPLMYQNRSPEWKEMWRKEYQKFLAEVEKDPELKKKGTKMVIFPSGEKILFETTEAMLKRRKIPIRSRIDGMRTDAMGKRG
jgi:hypothetical protein